MTDEKAPERIWACIEGPMVGLFVSGGHTAGWPEYIRADLIPSDQRAPCPPDGWNVMQMGQIGWHVQQEPDGWVVSRLFGAPAALAALQEKPHE